MSKRGGSAFREADLLDGRLRRLQARRERQKGAVDSAFQADLLTMLQAAQPWLRTMVREALAQDATQGELLAAIDAARVQIDPAERDAPAPAPMQLEADAPPSEPDGNSEWGMPRYPEPGEPAVMLPSGEVVAAGTLNGATAR